MGLSVMVTFTVLPSILYLPLTPFPEKLPDVVSPLKVAPFSVATFLASDTSVPGFFVAFMLKVRPSPSPPLPAEDGWVFGVVEEDPVRPVPREDLRGRRSGPLLCRLFVILPPPLERNSVGLVVTCPTSPCACPVASPARPLPAHPRLPQRPELRSVCPSPGPFLHLSTNLYYHNLYISYIVFLLFTI